MSILFFERKNYEMSCVRVRECMVTADLGHRIPDRDTLRNPHWCSLTREPQLQFEVKPSAYLTVTVVQSPPQDLECLSCTWNPASSCPHDHHAVKYVHSLSFTDLFFLRHDGVSPSLCNSRCLTFSVVDPSICIYFCVLGEGAKCCTQHFHHQLSSAASVTVWRVVSRKPMASFPVDLQKDHPHVRALLILH